MALQNQPRSKVEAWLKNFHATGDSLTTASLPKIYTRTARLRYANNEPVVGLDNIIKFFETAFATLSYMKHEMLHFDVVENTIYMSCNITYSVANDPEDVRIKIPAFGVFGMAPDVDLENEEGCLDDFGVYLDIGPVLERLNEVKKIKTGLS